MTLLCAPSTRGLATKTESPMGDGVLSSRRSSGDVNTARQLSCHDCNVPKSHQGADSPRLSTSSPIGPSKAARRRLTESGPHRRIATGSGSVSGIHHPGSVSSLALRLDNSGAKTAINRCPTSAVMLNDPKLVAAAVSDPRSPRSPSNSDHFSFSSCIALPSVLTAKRP